MIMSGSKDAVIEHVQLVDIHGTRLYDLVYRHDDTPGALLRARLGPEALYGTPNTGDRVRVSYLMGIATGMVRRDST
ncbi:MAG: hypothetical protein H7Y32_19280 [Chloroflexales bacterium]|nr:hypothetical protein [Chloroflexales bacterium]